MISLFRKRKKREQDLAWLVRAAYERGYKSSGNDWRQSWKQTPERATLARMGYIKEEDTWR